MKNILLCFTLLLLFGCDRAAPLLDNIENCNSINYNKNTNVVIIDRNLVELTNNKVKVKIPKCLNNKINDHLPIYIPRDPAKLYKWINNKIDNSLDEAIQLFSTEIITISAKVKENTKYQKLPAIQLYEPNNIEWILYSNKKINISNNFIVEIETITQNKVVARIRN